MANKTWRPRTAAVRGGTQRSPHGETSEALYLNSGFVYDSAEQAAARFRGEDEGFIYSRYGNPTVGMFEERLALLEGAEACFATASGMSAVFAALMCQLKTGDKVVASRALFGSCLVIVNEILPRFGVETVLVDGEDNDQWDAAITPGTACVFFESPSNPTLRLVDLSHVCARARAVGARVVVDNVFSSPILQKPLTHGADVVVYSGTKHIDGQGRCLGGAVLSSLSFRDDVLQPFLRHTGPALSPFNAWVLLKGLETLELRMDTQCRAAEELARRLERDPRVQRVHYPTLESHPQQGLARAQMGAGGSVVSLNVGEGTADAHTFLNRLDLIDISNNLGDSKSLITHPTTTTHRTLSQEDRLRVGIDDNLVRLSVGLEDIEDLWEDLDAALAG